MNPARIPPQTTLLSVNVNKIALMRNTRTVGVPSVTHLARIALEAGAHGITVHPRPDARHIRPSDVDELAQLLRAWPAAEFNIEGNPAHGLLDFVERVRPAQCTLVPDAPDAATSDHGWDVQAAAPQLRRAIERAKQSGARVSVFMDPVPEAMAPLAALGADRVELYTEHYARAFGASDEAQVLARYRDTALAAQRAGLDINAGHDLNLANLPLFLREVPGVAEVSIGHALIADALEFGLSTTVGKYLAAIALAQS